MVFIWDYNSKKIRRRGKEYIIWKLTRQINYGLQPGEKINATQLKKYWRFVKVDPQRKAMFRNLLWPKKQS